MRSPFEEWLHVLKFGELYEKRLEPVPVELTQEEGIEMALEQMRKVSASEELREMVELRMKALRDEATRLERAEQKGLEVGRAESLRQTARRMLQEGISQDVVLRVTGLRPEDVG